MTFDFALAQSKTWTSDNGNGTFTNPLFYDEFSDPDMIRVGEDFYLTGTTMHSMPGLPILHSKDLVNWTFLTYALERLDLGPEFRLEDNKSVYGQGIWAPSLRYNNGIFYIISNVNRKGLQVFTANNPKGPWKHTPSNAKLYDSSIIFDDDGKVYAVSGYQSIKLVELKPDLSDTIPGTEKEIIKKGEGMGEGLHIYKINGIYYITSAWYDGRMRMPAARAKNIYGPYEINQAISIDEDFGLNEGNRLDTPRDKPPRLIPKNYRPDGRVSLHQGGIIDTPSGEWWGFSMMDHNSVGRTTSLSPITWKDGWPYFGLPNNLTRNPRTWIKPDTGVNSKPFAPYKRSDDFSGESLNPIWQWSHVPNNDKWSLKERKGFLRLHSLPAQDFIYAKNSLTQRSIGPKSSPIVVLETKGMKNGDIAGLNLFTMPYAYLGIEIDNHQQYLVYFEGWNKNKIKIKLNNNRIYLKADCDYLNETAKFSYSLDGKKFIPIGEEFTFTYTLKTFQGIRYTLFNYNKLGTEGGYADFDEIKIIEPHPNGFMRPIPFNKTISLKTYKHNDLLKLANTTSFKIIDKGLGRVSLMTNNQYLTVNNENQISLSHIANDISQDFQWIETFTGELILMSLKTNRYLRIDPKTKILSADSVGPISDFSDGARFIWK